MKTTQEMIVVMQAYEDGRKIELTELGREMWTFAPSPRWDWIRFDYRIKPEPPKKRFVPYESAEEFLAAMKEHGPFIEFIAKYNPEGFKHNSLWLNMPVQVTDTSVFFMDLDYNGANRDHDVFYCIHYNELTEYKWQDGIPCGKEVIE